MEQNEKKIKVELNIKNFSKDSIILAQPKVDYYDYSEIYEIHDQLQSLFPNRVLTIPYGMELNIGEWEEIYEHAINYLQSIKPQEEKND